ncbi:MAG: BlaI/MecI/CopY family transcriptional regulator [Gemmatimonadota bacterium]
MARPTTPTLTEAELRLMKVLWDRGACSTSDVTETLSEQDVELTGSSVRTMLRILEQKGYVRSTRQGRAREYRPIVTRVEARRRALQYFLSRFFDGSREALLLNLLEDDEVEEAELERLKELLSAGGGDAE